MLYCNSTANVWYEIDFQDPRRKIWIYKFQHPVESELIDGHFLPVMCYNASDKFVSILLITLFLCPQI